MGKKRTEVKPEEGCSSCEDNLTCAETPKEVTEATAKAAKAPKEKAVANATYTFVKFPGEGEKNLPKQATQILEILSGNDGPMARKDLLEAMSGVVETRQPIERILGFYQPRLTEGGYFSVAK